jgi:hypothetical protein
MNERRKNMQQIVRSRKDQNGILVYSSHAGNDGEEFFSYGELADQKINALDFLKNPRQYQVDTVSHAIGLSR